MDRAFHQEAGGVMDTHETRLEEMLALGRGKKRRATLERQIRVMERELARVMRDRPFKWQQRSATITAIIKARKFALDQLPLFPDA